MTVTSLNLPFQRTYTITPGVMCGGGKGWNWLLSGFCFILVRYLSQTMRKALIFFFFLRKISRKLSRNSFQFSFSLWMLISGLHWSSKDASSLLVLVQSIWQT